MGLDLSYTNTHNVFLSLVCILERKTKKCGFFFNAICKEAYLTLGPSTLMKWCMYSGNKLHKEITSRVNSSFYCVPCAVFKFFVSIELFNPQKYTPFNSMQCLLVCSVWAHCNPRASHSAVYAHEHTWYILVFHPPALPVFFQYPTLLAPLTFPSPWL